MELQQIQAGIVQLRKNEAESKGLISSLALATVERVHQHNDVTSANSFIVALSPLNQKKVQKFMEAFTGHKMAEGVIGGRKKDYKKGEETVRPYQTAADAFKAFVETGMDFWQWAVMDSASKPEKPLDMAKLQKAAAKLHKMIGEAQAAGIIDTTATVQLLLGEVPLSQGEVLAALGAMAKAKTAIDNAENQAEAKAVAAAHQSVTA